MGMLSWAWQQLTARPLRPDSALLRQIAPQREDICLSDDLRLVTNLRK